MINCDKNNLEYGNIAESLPRAALFQSWTQLNKIHIFCENSFNNESPL